MQGFDAEILKVTDDLHYMYYAPDGYFDQKNCDIRLAVLKGKLHDEGIHFSTSAPQRPLQVSLCNPIKIYEESTLTHSFHPRCINPLPR
jgi:hypothetical protein